MPSLFAAVFCLTWLCASWSAGTPRLRPVCALIDRSTRLVEPCCSLSLVLRALPAPFRRLPLTTLSRVSCRCTWRLTCLWSDVRIFLHLCTASELNLSLQHNRTSTIQSMNLYCVLRLCILGTCRWDVFRSIKDLSWLARLERPQFCL